MVRTGSQVTSKRARAGRAVAVVVTVFSMLIQAVLILLGLEIVIFDMTDVEMLVLLGIWCGMGVLYSVLALIALSISAARPPAAAYAPTRFEFGRIARLVSIVATIVPSVIGLIAAIMVVATDSPDEWGVIADIVGVSAMLIAWGLMHWGFAQIYFQRYHRALRLGEGKTVSFPGTDRPVLVDFVYFAYTIAATFATSDALVLKTRTRWLVTWHTVISFFFNGLIIVFALTTIMQR